MFGKQRPDLCRFLVYGFYVIGDLGWYAIYSPTQANHLLQPPTSPLFRHSTTLTKTRHHSLPPPSDRFRHNQSITASPLPSALSSLKHLRAFCVPLTTSSETVRTAPRHQEAQNHIHPHFEPWIGRAFIQLYFSGYSNPPLTQPYHRQLASWTPYAVTTRDRMPGMS